MVRSLLQLSEIWPRHIWLTGRMKFASLEANLGGDIVCLFVCLFLLLYVPSQQLWSLRDGQLT